MQHKRNTSFKNLIGSILIFIAASACTGCGEKPVQQTSVSAVSTVSEEQVLEIPELETEDTAVFVEYMPEKADIRLMSADNGRTYTVSVNELTTFSDNHGRVSVAELFEPGMIVRAKISIHSRALKSLAQAADAVVRRDVTDFEINMNRGVFRLSDGTNLHITEHTAVFKNGLKVKAEDISKSDTLVVRSVGHELYSIVISSGYGHLRIKGTQFFSGGWVQIAGMIRPVADDSSMLLDVPEGEYELIVTYKGRGGSKNVVINRGKESVIDVSDMKEDLVKTGELVFTIRPIDALAKVKIDGKEVDHLSPVTLEYGVYMMEVSAPGYAAIKERISVGSDVSNIDIELQQSETEENKDTALKDKEADKDTDTDDSTGILNTPTGLSGSSNTGSTSTTSSTTSSSSTDTGSADSSVLYGNHIYIEAPEYAEVYFDGIYKGIIPCSFTKESGTHVITLRRDGYETRTFTVTLDTTTQNETYSFSELQAK